MFIKLQSLKCLSNYQIESLKCTELNMFIKLQSLCCTTELYVIFIHIIRCSYLTILMFRSCLFPRAIDQSIDRSIIRIFYHDVSCCVINNVLMIKMFRIFMFIMKKIIVLFAKIVKTIFKY